MSEMATSETPDALRFLERTARRGNDMITERILQQHWTIKSYNIHSALLSGIEDEWRDVPLVIAPK